MTDGPRNKDPRKFVSLNLRLNRLAAETFCSRVLP